MKILVVAVLAIAVVLATALTSLIGALPVFGGKNDNMQMLEAFNVFMCSTGSQYCVEAGNIDFDTLRKNVPLRAIEFAHEMIQPKSLKQKIVRHNLPKSVQDMFALAKKHLHKHQASDLAPEIAHKVASARAVKDAVSEMTGGSLSSSKYAYFGWLPQWAGDSMIGSSASFSTSCVGEVKVSTSLSGNTLTATTTASKDGFLCDDMVLLLVGDGAFGIQVIDKDAPKTWSVDISKFTVEQRWYMNRHGVRILKFPKGLVETIGQLIATVTEMAGYFEHHLTNATFDANIQFLKDYVEVSPRMQPLTKYRSAGDSVGLNDEIQKGVNSGDSFIVMRPDGLDPMIGWGEGWTSGHSTIAMRNASGFLFVCESTTKDAYWPTNGIQCNPYRDWIQQYSNSQTSILHAPLSPEYRAKFNADKAWEFFRSHEGVNYGFGNFLFGWVDLETGNFPCLPPSFSETCLMKEAVEQLAFVVDRLSGDTNTNIFRQAIAHRCGTPESTSVLSSFYQENMKNGNNVTFADIYTRVEQDSWNYNMSCNNGTTVQTQCSVCCVFVCRMWKAAGLFSGIDDEINCGEQTLWDIFSMNIYDASRMGENRPEVCKQADPDNQLCQLTGSLTLNGKPDFNTRKLYKHMGEKCGSLSPDYIRAPGC